MAAAREEFDLRRFLTVKIPLRIFAREKLLTEGGELLLDVLRRFGIHSFNSVASMRKWCRPMSRLVVKYIFFPLMREPRCRYTHVTPHL